MHFLAFVGMRCPPSVARWTAVAPFRWQGGPLWLLGGKADRYGTGFKPWHSVFRKGRGIVPGRESTNSQNAGFSVPQRSSLPKIDNNGQPCQPKGREPALRTAGRQRETGRAG